MAEAMVRLPIRLLCYCLMPNHFHFVLGPHADGDLDAGCIGSWRLMSGATCAIIITAAMSGRADSEPSPIQDDDHLLTVMRYVERNPLRANLVASARDWLWSTLGAGANGPPIDDGPVPPSAEWHPFVNSAMN